MILIVFLFLVTSLARLEAEIPIPAPSYTNPNVTPMCDDWVGKGGRAEGSTSVTSFGEPQRHRHQQLLPLPLILPPSFTDPMVTNVCDICLSIEGSTSVANDIFLNFWSLL